MLRWLLFLILGVWVLRLFQAGRPRVQKPRSSDFHPSAGAGDPSAATGEEDSPAFSSGDIVDAEFEEIPGPPPS